MKLKDRFLFLVAVVAISASLFVGLSAIVDNFDTASMRPVAASPSSLVMGAEG